MDQGQEIEEDVGGVEQEAEDDIEVNLTLYLTVAALTHPPSNNPFAKQQ